MVLDGVRWVYNLGANEVECKTRGQEVGKKQLLEIAVVSSAYKMWRERVREMRSDHKQ